MKPSRNKQSSLLSKYTELYERKPKSRVFAPLAETYRKLGMYDEAFNILRKGINIHPAYTLGYIVLANCYFDKGQLELAYNVLRPHVEKNLENISLQKLFSKISEQLGYLEEALQTYKYLLLLNPSDKEVAVKVKELETDLSYDYEKPIINKFNEPNSSKNTQDFDNDDDWVQVSFNSPPISAPESYELEEEDDVENWNMSELTDVGHLEDEHKKVIQKFKAEIQIPDRPILEKSLDDDYFYEDYDNHDDDVVEAEGQEPQSPIITHTLVELFLKQGHKDRAIEILENILQLHPEDEVSRTKLKEIKKSDVAKEGYEHNELLDLIDEKRKKENLVVGNVEKKLQEFLNMLKVAAKENCGDI